MFSFFFSDLKFQENGKSKDSQFFNKIGEETTVTNNAILYICDSIDILSGKWRIKILISLFGEKKRFSQLSHELDGISDRTLSKELKDLEQNMLIEKSNNLDNPSITEYSITKHTLSLIPVLIVLKEWGKSHRNIVFKIHSK